MFHINEIVGMDLH